MKNICDCSVSFGKFIVNDYRRSVIVTDRHIAELYGIKGDNVLFLPRGEQAKSFANVQQLCTQFVAQGVQTDSQVVAVGGGSIGDAVGFACSVYKRGVQLLHIPTTLLAMVDSSIGGKTALDLDGVKNAVGSYWFADTLIDTDFLKTLDETQLKSGMGEILKYRMLDGEIDRAKQDLTKTVKLCAQYKQSVCLADPYCNGKRNALNFGHTVGHAMELSLDVPHGVAVANGIYYETLIAFKLGLCTQDYAQKWCAEAKEHFDIFPITQQILNLTAQDKKNRKGAVGVVLPPSFDVVQLPFERLGELILN